MSEAPRVAGIVEGSEARRMSRRHLLQAGGSFLLSGSLLAACGGDSSGSGASAAGKVTTKPVTLTVWEWEHADTPGFVTAQKLIDAAFKKRYPNVTLVREYKPYGEYFTLLQSAIARRKGPDVVMNFGSSFAADFRRGLLPLQDRAKSIKGLQFVADSITGEKELLTVPYTTYLTRLAYNKAVFTKVGLDPERPPQTWPEFLAACEKVKAAGLTPIAAGFKDGYMAEWFMFSLTNQTVSKEDIRLQYRRELPWTAPGIKTGLSRLVELAERDFFSKNSASKPSSPDPKTQFDAGKAAFIVSQETSLNATAKAIGEKNLGQMLMPRLEESLYETPIVDATYNLGYSITRFSKQPDVAWAFIEHTLGPAQQEKAWDPGEFVPNNSLAKVSSDYAPQQKLLDWVIDNDDPHFGITFSVQEAAMFEKLAPQLIAGRVKVDAALDKLETLRAKLGPV